MTISIGGAMTDACSQKSPADQLAVLRAFASLLVRIPETPCYAKVRMHSNTAAHLRRALNVVLDAHEKIDAACLRVCPDNNAEFVDPVDPDLGRYLVCDENGSELIDTDDPAEVIIGLHGLWGRVSDGWEGSLRQVADLEGQNAELRAQCADVERLRLVVQRLRSVRDEVHSDAIEAQQQKDHNQYYLAQLVDGLNEALEGTA